MAKGATATPDAPAEQSTGLAVINPNTFLALNLPEEIKAAQEAAAATGETFGVGDLVRVKTPAGGGTNWVIPSAAGDESTPEIVGVLCCYQPAGVLWPSDDPAPGTLPVLRTFNPTDPNAVAEQVGPIPDGMMDSLMKHKISDGPPATFKWANLPQNQWGSGKRQIGKACKESRMLFILRQGDIYPLLVRAQPGSIRNVTQFFRQLTPTAKVPYFRCVVSLTLTKATSKGGQEFSKIVPRLVGILPSDTGEIIRQKYTAVLQTIVKQIDDEPAETEGDE